MTPELKYGLIALFILLDVCVVVFMFSGNPTQPVKQAAAPPPSTQPAVQQPPSQNPVQKPPVQQSPQPTPQQIAEAQRQEAKRIEEARLLADCNQKQAEYTKLFVQDAPTRLRQIYTQYNSLHDPSPAANTLGELIQQMRDRRISWELEKRRCLQLPNWRLVLSDADVSRVLREDCLQRSRNYQWFFEQMQNMTEYQKERFLAARSPKEPPYRQFVANWEGLDRRCFQDVSGWTTPPETRAAYQQQANSPR